MKRALFLLLIGFSLVTLACSLTSGLASSKTPLIQPTPLQLETALVPTMVEPTQAVATQATPIETSLPPTSTQASIPPTSLPPTSTAAPSTTTNLPLVMNPSQEPTSTGPLIFSETFDQPNDHWTDALIVTSQASGHDPFYKVSLEAGRMKFAIQDKETYIYKFFKPSLESTSSITVTYEYRTLANNGVALVCMADADMTAWYEARLISGESKYSLYVYNQREKDQIKNPYTLLTEGILTTKEFSPAKSNTVTFTCTDHQLKLDLNDGSKVITQPVRDNLKGSQVGIGVMSFSSLPVNIDFKTVEILSQK
jgi:hypothetical protein